MRIIVLLVFISGGVVAKGQQRFTVDTKVDSARFAQSRAVLNALPAVPFTKHIYKVDSNTIPYRLLQPKQYEARKKYPLIIALHNSSRLGDDNEQQLEPLTRIWLRDEIAGKYPAFVLAPQFKKRSSVYTGKDSLLFSHPSDDVPALLKLIHELEAQHSSIDLNRVYLVGYSMGASTAQNLLSLEPDHFAAIVSVAGVPDTQAIEKMKKKNILLIHGKMDTENPYSGSEYLYNRLKGNRKLSFYTYSNLDHNNITIPFLLSAMIPDWLFKQKK
ncbi:MAG: hypothetical protein J7578_07060 [Chitinophagaceae bacterium]|nr:hypothetical protein [Chitinophagaceae bacterium]